MKKTITRETIYKESFRTAKAAGIFDISPEKKLKRTWEVELPIETKKWQIGLIVGSSGSGKTTLAKDFFKDSYCQGFDWDGRSILDNFDESLDIKVIIDALCHIGFSSPPNWLLPYHALSNGQQFRVDVARTLLEQTNLAVIDEFTSVVDRTVAKISCAAIMINSLTRKITILQDAKKFGTREVFYKLFGWSKKQIEFKFDCEFGRIDGHGVMFHIRAGEIININKWKKENITSEEITIVKNAKKKLKAETIQISLKKLN